MKIQLKISNICGFFFQCETLIMYIKKKVVNSNNNKYFFSNISVLFSSLNFWQKLETMRVRVSQYKIRLFLAPKLGLKHIESHIYVKRHPVAVSNNVSSKYIV